jgi:hypothetical protein
LQANQKSNIDLQSISAKARQLRQKPAKQNNVGDCNQMQIAKIKTKWLIYGHHKL